MKKSFDRKKCEIDYADSGTVKTSLFEGALRLEARPEGRR